MGVYTQSNIESTNLEEAGIIESSFEPGIEAACNIVVENEHNYNAIMRAVGVQELAAFEETGAEMVYEASDVSGFIAKVKEFFVKLWEKIKGLFKKFFALFDSYTKSDKDFINKYRKHLLSINTRDFSYKGFDFSELNYDIAKASASVDKVAEAAGFGGSIPASASDIESALKNVEDKEEIVGKMRAKSIGKESTLEASEFSKELFSFFRSGEDSKVELNSITVSDQLGFISENSGLKKSAEKSYKDLEKSIKDVLKALDNQEKELVKKVPSKDTVASSLHAKQIRFVSASIQLAKDAQNVLQLVNGAKLTAIKDQNRQAKAICVALMNYKPKNESTSVMESGSFISGVVLR
jgi:hypothetical protein